MKPWTTLARASLFRQFTATNVYVYGTGSVEIWKTRHKISVNIRIFFTVYVTHSHAVYMPDNVCRLFRSIPGVVNMQRVRFNSYDGNYR